LPFVIAFFHFVIVVMGAENDGGALCWVEGDVTVWFS
jgi:hypothetical protein